MTTPFTAGSKGPRVKGDCFVNFVPDDAIPLAIEVISSVKTLYGEAITELAQRVCTHFGIDRGLVTIEDTGALDFVIAARLEACIKKAVDSELEFLPDMLAENQYASAPGRMRMSRLYLPGNSPRMMINAGLHGPHGVILDLEDAVAVAKKDEARLLVRNALRQVDFFGAERMVRINQLPRGLTDLAAVIPHNVHLILVPKCESAGAIHQVNAAIAGINEKNSTVREVFLMPIIESSRGIINAAAIAGAADNIVAMAIGLEDYTADMGVRRTRSGTESFYARSHLVTVCKAHGIQAIDSVFSDVADMAALAETVAESRTLGFEGMGCIHPRQIPVVHRGYAPDSADIDKAGRIVLAFEAATKEGLGVVSLGSKMIDPPVVERARQTIAQALAMNIITEDWRAAYV